MARSCVTLAVVLALSFVLSSCRPAEVVVGRPDIESVLATESLVSKETIPPGYGRLVGVIQSPWNDEMAILWFEKPDKTITVVTVDFQDRRIVSSAVQVPRR